MYLNRYYRYLNLILSGVFLICFSIDSFLIFGEYGKYISLFGGFGFLLTSYKSVNISTSNLRFFIVSLILYLLFSFIAYLNNQDVFDLLDILFGVICLLLLNIGYGYSSYVISFREFYINPFLTYGIPLASIIGVVFLIQFQSTLVYDIGVNTRGYGSDSDLNPVGVAYIHGLLFIINFVLYQKLPRLSSIAKGVYIVGLFALFISIVTTLSRGALLFICLYIVYFYLVRIQVTNGFFSNFVKFSILVLVAFFVINSLISYVPLLEDKFGQYSARVTSLFDYVDSSYVDESAEERLTGYGYFFDNLEHIIIFGMKGYSIYPHNQFLEIIMRWGIFGLPLLLFSIYTIMKTLFNFRLYLNSLNTIGFLIVSLFIFSYFQSMISLSLEMNRMMWLGMGFVYGIPQKPFS